MTSDQSDVITDDVFHTCAYCGEYVRVNSQPNPLVGFVRRNDQYWHSDCYENSHQSNERVQKRLRSIE